MIKAEKIEFISFNKGEGNFYYKYLGTGEEASVTISWRGITKYHCKMIFEQNSNIIYYIGTGPSGLDFFEEIDEFCVDFDFKEGSQKIIIPIVSGGEKKIIYRDLKTIKEDSVYDTYQEIFNKKIYISDRVKVEKDDLVVDIGSNYGFFSVQSLEMGAKRVICYEPSKILQEYLNYNLNNGKVEINNKAVSGKSGNAKFKDHLISSASSRIEKIESGDSYDIEIVGINDLLDSVGEIIDFLKIDCEGEEIEIFQSIKDSYFSRIKKTAVEFHDDNSRILISEKLISGGMSIEKIENSIIYAYNPIFYPSLKKVALISTFCDNEEKQKVLEENIIKIKSLGIDIIAISPIEIPQRIISLCDYFFYTKDNPLLEWPIRMYTHWYQMRLPDGRITTLQRGLADYGWCGLYQVKKLSQIALTFDYDIFYHLIYDLEIDEVVEGEFISNGINIVHPRRDPHHPEDMWEATLHFMVFERSLMEKIEKEITLDEYLRTSGMAEGEVLKWKNKFNIPVSDHPVRDKIFYWGNYDFFDYSLFDGFKMFLSKNEPMTIWLGEDPVYDSMLTDNLRIVFHGFETMDTIQIKINGIDYFNVPKPWEIIEFPISSQEIKEIIFIYREEIINFTGKYNDIMMNQIYYNHRP